MTDPAWLARARLNLGVRETPGAVSTQSILNYRKHAHTPFFGDDGGVPWCAIFVNAMLELVGIAGTRSAMARSFSRYGTPLPLDRPPPLGAIAVFSSSRGATSGHVAFVVGWTPTHVRVLGGNQADAVSIATFPRSRLVALVWPAGQQVPDDRLAQSATDKLEPQVSDA